MVLTNTSCLSTKHFANRQFHKSVLLVCGVRHFRNAVLSSKLSEFKVLNNLLVKVHVLVFFIPQSMVILGIRTNP